MTVSGDIFLFFIGLLALILMGMGRQSILFAMSSSMLWFVLFIWLFFSTTPPLTVGQTWVDILAWVFVMLVFVPWLVRMDTEIKHEADGKSWKRWDTEPHLKSDSEYEKYRRTLFNKTRGGKER